MLACIVFRECKHYVVFERMNFNHMVIVDPVQGRKKYSYKKLSEHFSNMVLVPNEIDKKIADGIKQEKIY